MTEKTKADLARIEAAKESLVVFAKTYFADVPGGWNEERLNALDYLEPMLRNRPARVMSPDTLTAESWELVVSVAVLAMLIREPGLRVGVIHDTPKTAADFIQSLVNALEGNRELRQDFDDYYAHCVRSGIEKAPSILNVVHPSQESSYLGVWGKNWNGQEAFDIVFRCHWAG